MKDNSKKQQNTKIDLLNLHVLGWIHTNQKLCNEYAIWENNVDVSDETLKMLYEKIANTSYRNINKASFSLMDIAAVQVLSIKGLLCKIGYLTQQLETAIKERDWGRAEGVTAKLDEIMAGMQTGQAEILSAVLDRNKHSGEKWATIPDCIRCYFELVEEDKKVRNCNYSTVTYETMRLAVNKILKANNSRMIPHNRSHFYLVHDIVKAIRQKYKDFSRDSLITEFEAFACEEGNLHKAPKLPKNK